MNEDYYHEQNSCYDSNSFGFDQFQTPQYSSIHPIFYSTNAALLNSQNKLMEQMTTLRDLVDQSSVEDLVPIPSESEGTPDKMCDVLLCENTTSLKAFKEHSETIINSNDDNSSSDDDSSYGEDIDYIDASSPDVEISTSTFPDLFLEEANTFDNSFPESETFRFNLEEISSGSPATHSELSLPDFISFYG
ncbi:hypothetical protein Tco_0491986 [Tanacetum coccineum]